MILSAAMMLDHIGEAEKAEQIRKAIAAVVAEGKVRTYDMMRMSGRRRSRIAQGAASTTADDRRDSGEARASQWRRLMPVSSRS